MKELEFEFDVCKIDLYNFEYGSPFVLASRSI